MGVCLGQFEKEQKEADNQNAVLNHRVIPQ